MKRIQFLLLVAWLCLTLSGTAIGAVVLYAKNNRVMVGSGVDGTVRWCVQGEGDPTTFYCSASPIEVRPGRAGQ